MSNKKQLKYDLISKYRSALMGAAIISIILFHFTEDCRSMDMHFKGLIKLYYYAIGSSGVDMFLILSGFGIFYSLKKNPETSKRNFYLKRFAKVLLPYLIVAIPGWAWRTIITGSGNIGNYFLDITFVSLFTDGKIWFWFILLICLFYIAAPLLFKMIDDSVDDKKALARTGIAFAVITAVNCILLLTAKGFYDDTNLFFLRIFPFFMGLYLGRVAYKEKPIAKWVVIICLISIICLPTRMINIIFMRYALAFFHTAVFLLYIALLEYAPFKKIKAFIVKILEWLGRYTLELYLCHVLARNIFIHYGFNTAYFKYEILMLCISFCIAILLKKISTVITEKLFFKSIQT